MRATDFPPHFDLRQAGRAFAAGVPRQAPKRWQWCLEVGVIQSLYVVLEFPGGDASPLRSFFRGVGQSSSESGSRRPIGPIASAAALPCRHYRAQALAIGQRANGRSAGPRPSDTLPEAAFDLVDARLVLMRLPYREAVLHRLVLRQ